MTLKRTLVVGFVLIDLAAVFSTAAIRYGMFDLSQETLEQKYLRSESRFITVDGVRFHYLEAGEGPVVLLLHASRNNAQMWLGWMEHLSSNYRVLAVDNTSMGLTGLDPTGDYSLEREVSLLSGFLTTLEIKSVAVAGTSYGGILAYRLAADDPRIKALILANAAGLPRAPGESPNQPEANPILRWVYKYYWPRTFFESSLPRAFGDSSLATPELVQQIYDFARREGAAEARRTRLNQYDIGDVASILGSISVPVLIQWSTRSVALPVTEAERFSAFLTNTETTQKLYPGKGHWFVMEAPVETARDVEKFLDTVDLQ